MATLTITVDERTETDLQSLSVSEGLPPSEIASRLLRRAVRARKPRPQYDVDAIRAAAATFSDEDLQLAEEDSAHRLQLLTAEDTAS